MTRTIRKVALVPWGDVIEDYLAALDCSLQAFCSTMAGGWLYGYVEALKHAGIEAVIICVAHGVTEPQRFTHTPTGCTVWALPAPWHYRAARAKMREPSAWAVDEMFGPSHGIRRLGLRMLRAATPYLAFPAPDFARTLRRERCDAVICQEHEYARFDLLTFLSTTLGLPAFASFQGGVERYSRFESLFRWLSLRLAAGFITPSHDDVARLCAAGVPAHRIHFIPNPLDIDSWQLDATSDSRTALAIPSCAAVFAWHGRIALRHKGLDILLEAWTQLQRRAGQRELRLLLIGNGADAEPLRQQLASHDLRSVIWFDDFILDRSQLRELLSAADCYVFASRHEGSPVALLEAMASGLPIAASAIPSVRELVEGVARLAPAEDSAALADAMWSLLTDPEEARRLGAAARQRARERASLPVVGQALAAALHSRA